MAASSANPYVSLTFNDLNPANLTQLSSQSLGDPIQVLESALMSYRLLVVNKVKEDLKQKTTITAVELVRLADLAGQVYLGRWNKLVGPAAADAYIRAYRAANAGEVPMSTIYALAEQHSARLGKYFNDTSNEALASGFNTLVNQKVPARVAAERALDAYGLTPRQMSGLTSMKAGEKVNSATPRALTARVKEYIGRSLRGRFRIFAEQESHNLDSQAHQTAWLWMQGKGMIPETAEKMWLTAKDEKVCPQCGPLHGKKVLLNEQFQLPNGTNLWVPGAHTNCRCEVRLVVPGLALVSKADSGDRWYNDEYKRTSDGRFSAKNRAKATLQERAAQAPTRFKPVGFADAPERNAALDQMIEEAERLRTQPVEKPVETKVELPSSTGRVLLGRSSPVSLDRVNLPAQKIDLSPSKTELSRERPAIERQKIQIPLKDRIELRRDTEKVVLEQLQTEKAKPKKSRLFYRPTVKVQDENGRQYPVYAVFNKQDLDPDGKIEVTADIDWTSEEMDVVQHANNRFHAVIEDTYNQVAYEGPMEMTGRDGTRYTAEIADEDLYDLIAAVAYGNKSGDPDWHGENITTTVSWTDEDGSHAFAEKKTYGELAQHYGISPEEFDIVVLRLDEGHDSSLGRTWNEPAGKTTRERWHTTGTYITEHSNYVQMGKSAPIHFLNAIPDVETEEFGDHPDD